MFTYINDNFLHAPSTDLSRDVVKLLVGIMKAQATEVFIETMGPGSAKGAGLRSKLCHQAALLYGAVVEEVKEFVGKGVLIQAWSLMIQSKAKHFASQAQYFRALADQGAHKYGEGLARLAVAENLAREGLQQAKYLAAGFSTTTTSTSLAPDAPANLLELTKAHLALVSDARVKAQKDNDVVYNETIPSEASLAPLDKGKDVAEPIAIHDVYATPEVQKIVGPDLFVRLVPLSVHESASMYSEEKAKLARQEAEKAELGDVELAAALEYMGLPASLERFRTGGNGQAALADPGPQVRTWVDEVRANESQGTLDSQLQRLQSLQASASSTLEATSAALEDESRECEKMRSTFQHLWTQSPSSAYTKGFRQDLSSHRESLALASQSDAQALRLWKSVRQDALLLAGPSNEPLERAVAAAIASGGGAPANLLDNDPSEDEETEMAKHVEAISDNLSRLNKIKRERGEVLKDLKERIQADDISQLLILNRKASPGTEPALFASELEKYRPHQQRIAATLHHQQATLAEISQEFKALTEGGKARQLQDQFAGAEVRKRELVQRLGKAAQAYAEVRAGVQRGLHFYGDLVELVQGLKRQVDGFVAQREGERSQLASAAEMQQRLEGPKLTSPYSQLSSAPATGLETQMGGMNLGSRSPALSSGGGQPPSWQQQHQYPYSSGPSPAPSSVSSPPPLPQPRSPSAAAPSPYSFLPSSGAFATSGAHTPAVGAPVSTNWSSSVVSPLPRQSSYPPLGQAGYVSHGQPPAPPQVPRPPAQPMYGSSAGSGAGASLYGGLPAPSQPVGTGGGSYLPPPPAPVAYQSTGQQQGQYGAPPPPPSQSHSPYQPQSYYGASPPPAPPQQQAQYSGYGGAPAGQQAQGGPYGQPPAPPRPGTYGSYQAGGQPRGY